MGWCRSQSVFSVFFPFFWFLLFSCAFYIDDTFFVWFKISLASYSVDSISFFWSILIKVVLMKVCLTTSLFPGTPHFLRTLLQSFSWGTSVSWLIFVNLLKQCHYVVTIASFPCRAWACCFVHLTRLLTQLNWNIS